MVTFTIDGLVGVFGATFLGTQAAMTFRRLPRIRGRFSKGTTRHGSSDRLM